MGQRCVVTGANGFLGRHLCRLLIERGAHVVAIGRTAAPPAELAGEVDWQTGEYADPAVMERCLPGADLLFHLAGGSLPSVSDRDPFQSVHQSVMPTMALLDAAARLKVGRFIFPSSGGTVYGIPGTVPIPEDASTDPITCYGANKLAIEKYLEIYRRHHGLDYRVVRIANPYGPGQASGGSQGVIANILAAATEDRAFPLWGDGSIIRDFIFVTDTVEAILAVANYEGRHRVMNVGGGAGMSINDVIGSIEAVIGRPLAVTRLAARPADVPSNVLDIQRIRVETGWQPLTALEDGLTLAVEWLRQGQRMTITS